MKISDAVAIFRNINLSETTTEEKQNAIRKVITMETHNSFTKQEFINALDWLLNEQPKNNGWIPCSSGNFSTSEVLVCKEDGTIDFDVFDFMYEDWKFNSNHHKNKVIAWMPLPAPYKEGSE